MKISLVQIEIEEAIKEYITKSVSIPSNKKLRVDIAATRGANGVTAEITIEDASAPETAEVKPEPCNYVANEEVHGDTQEAEEVKPAPAKKKSFFENL